MKLDITESEAAIILLAIEGLFQNGSLRGPLDEIEKAVNAAKSVKGKLEAIKKPPEGG